MSEIQKVIDGLLVFAKHPNAQVCAEHDELYAGCDSALSEEEIARLKELGWHERKNVGWVKFT